MTDLPLFNWRPTAKVIPFPGGRRTGKARQVAKLYLSKTAKQRRSYWYRIADDYVAAQTNVGISEFAARASLDEFREAVEREIALIEARGMLRK
ncbi:DUF6074 family protein [Ahrensia marina]|uniref:Uncharacterized protein n=1 Tax=Ahrensia marina TaxID=1514904 RepID=A0A0N0E7N3_9HYPH|nr:DUF6074 family protein [Ahrensia marina]KPB01372.1 hypothetical protein SU32_08980 [Ahrensia marina]